MTEQELEVKKPEKKDKKKKGLIERLFNKNRLKKPSMVAVIYLRDNGIAEAMEIETKRGFFNIGERTYHEDRDCIYTISKERLPLAIIREKDLIPLGTRRWEDQDLISKLSELQDHVLRGIRHAELVKMGGGEGLKLNKKAIVGAIIGVIILIAILMNFGA